MLKKMTYLIYFLVALLYVNMIYWASGNLADLSYVRQVVVYPMIAVIFFYNYNKSPMISVFFVGMFCGMMWFNLFSDLVGKEDFMKSWIETDWRMWLSYVILLTLITIVFGMRKIYEDYMGSNKP